MCDTVMVSMPWVAWLVNGESRAQSQVCLILESTFNHYISLLAHSENFSDSVDWNIVSGGRDR